jgi:hypothetical protein
LIKQLKIKPIQVIIHIYIEMLQGNSLTILNKQKCHFFFLYKIGEQEGGSGPVLGVGTSGREEERRKGMEG